MPYAQNLDGIGFEAFPAEEHIVQPRADDAERDGDEREIEHGILRQTQAFFLAGGKQQAKRYGRHHQNAVKGNAQPADMQG